MATYARASKTAQASYVLALRGYGAQAGMLNRSLFEDMIVAHWIRANAEKAPQLFERHRKHTLTQLRGKYAKYGREDEVAAWPDLDDDERVRLEREFERKPHWTKKSLYELVKAVEHEWEGEHTDRRMLWQTFDIAHRFNNLILHHSFFGLGLAGKFTPERMVRWDVGNSAEHIHGALQVAWFSYVHLLSLVVPDNAREELGRVFTQHLSAFATFRLHEDGEPDTPSG